MRKSAIAIVAGIAIVIILVVFLPLKPGGMPPIIQDQITIEERTQIEIETAITDEPNLKDRIELQESEGLDVYVDEDGVKHYFISVVDTPDIEG